MSFTNAKILNDNFSIKEEIADLKHKVMIIFINGSFKNNTTKSIYEAVRKSWIASQKKQKNENMY